MFWEGDVEEAEAEAEGVCRGREGKKESPPHPRGRGGRAENFPTSASPGFGCLPDGLDAFPRLPWAVVWGAGKGTASWRADERAGASATRLAGRKAVKKAGHRYYPSGFLPRNRREVVPCAPEGIVP